MNSKVVKGLPVINVTDGSKIGDLERAFLDPNEKRIVGFVIDTGGGIMAPEHALLADAGEVHSLGEAALTLENAEPRGSEMTARYSDLIDLASLGGRHLYTAGGTHLGQISSSNFDERGYRLVDFDVSPGFFQTHRRVGADAIITIGPEVVVVDDGALTPGQPEPEGETSPG